MLKSVESFATGFSIRVRYLLGLGFIALLVTASFLTLQQSIEEQRKYAHLINLASHQAGLANRIAYFASLMVSARDEDEYAMARSQVKRSLHRIENAHRLLRQGDTLAGIEHVSNANLEAIYSGELLNLDRALERFVQYATRLVDNDDASVGSIEYLYLVTYGPHKLEPMFNEAVNEYERISDDAIAKTQRLQLTLWLITLLMLVLELPLIFRPLELGIRDAIASLNKTIAELGQTRNKLMLAKQWAEQASEAKSRFLATMSHELRTPMNGVIGTAELLSHSPLDSDQQDHVRTIISSSELLLSIINDVLDFSKLDAGKVKVEHIPFDLEQLARDVLALLKPSCLEKQLSLILEYPLRAPRRFIGDPLRIRQIVFNLVGNAIKFTDQGHVCLSVAVESSARSSVNLTLSVEDTGIGIEANRVSSLFIGFSQGDNSTTRRYGGTGLGLSITSQLVRLMSGDIEVESLHGTGSTFHVKLPLDVEDHEQRQMIGDLEGTLLYYLGDDERSRKVFEGYAGELGLDFVAMESLAGIPPLDGLSVGGQDAVHFLVVDFSSVEEARRLTGLIATDVDWPRQLRVVVHRNQPEDYAPCANDLSGAGVRFRMLDKPMTASGFVGVLDGLRGGQDAPYNEAVVGQDSDDGEVDPVDTVRRVLLVEDVVVNQKVAMKILGLLGMQVDLAENGDRAISMWEEGQYDLILMDCQMPVMDGYTASRIIRSRETQSHAIPIIALTANASTEDQQKCLASGMNAVVTKPFKMQTLKEALQRWMSLPAEL